MIVRTGKIISPYVHLSLFWSTGPKTTSTTLELQRKFHRLWYLARKCLRFPIENKNKSCHAAQWFLITFTSLFLCVLTKFHRKSPLLMRLFCLANFCLSIFSILLLNSMRSRLNCRNSGRQSSLCFFQKIYIISTGRKYRPATYLGIC